MATTASGKTEITRQLVLPCDKAGEFLIVDSRTYDGRQPAELRFACGEGLQIYRYGAK